MDDRNCACVSDDRYDCWRQRYHLAFEDDIEVDGGPCECACHEHAEEERVNG